MKSAKIIHNKVFHHVLGFFGEFVDGVVCKNVVLGVVCGKNVGPEVVCPGVVCGSLVPEVEGNGDVVPRVVGARVGT